MHGRNWKAKFSSPCSQNFGVLSAKHRRFLQRFSLFWIITRHVVAQEYFRRPAVWLRKKAHFKTKFIFSVGKFKTQKMPLCRAMDCGDVFRLIFFHLHLPLQRWLTLPHFWKFQPSECSNTESHFLRLCKVYIWILKWWIGVGGIDVHVRAWFWNWKLYQSRKFKKKRTSRQNHGPRKWFHADFTPGAPPKSEITPSYFAPFLKFCNLRMLAKRLKL